MAVAAILVVAVPAARAEYHTFQIELIFSNFDGTVQFVVVHEFAGLLGENMWMTNDLTSTHSGGSQTLTFDKNLPGGIADGAYDYGMGALSQTAYKRVLIATRGFAALGLVTPDFVVPDGFLPIGGGTLNYADVDSVTFAALPTDGVGAINRNGAVIRNLATNFAGQSASVSVAAGPAAPIIPVNGVWYDPNEPGSGFSFDHQYGTLIVEVDSYLPGGAAQWYLAAGPVENNVFTATLDKYVGDSASHARTRRPHQPVTMARSCSPRPPPPTQYCPADARFRSGGTSSRSGCGTAVYTIRPR